MPHGHRVFKKVQLTQTLCQNPLKRLNVATRGLPSQTSLNLYAFYRPFQGFFNATLSTIKPETAAANDEHKITNFA